MVNPDLNIEYLNRIICPSCGNVFSIGIVPIKDNMIQCPGCFSCHPIDQYERKLSYYPFIGFLKIVDDTEIYQLRTGMNIIGRHDSSRELADFPIDTKEKKHLSRQQVNIEVKQNPNKGYLHLISMCRAKLNNTYVSGRLLHYGENLCLKHQDIIQLPDICLKLFIFDS